jgi:hypothetical protein
VTVTWSATSPTAKVMSSRVVEFTWRVTPELRNFLKPGLDAATVYTPGFKLGAVYLPLSLVVAAVTWFVAS